jgi:alkylated DNA repair dioxygenase AlkB
MSCISQKNSLNKVVNTSELSPGLIIIPGVIDARVEQLLIKKADQKTWDGWLKRRTQHYGYEYHYDTRRIGSAVKIPLFIRRTRWHIERIIRKQTGLSIPPTKSPADQETGDWTGKYPAYFDQSIANEYTPGQGIGKHTDQPQLFSEIIAILSLGSDITMIFERGTTSIPVRMHRRSLILMTGEVRYSYGHTVLKAAKPI